MVLSEKASSTVVVQQGDLYTEVLKCQFGLLYFVLARRNYVLVFFLLLRPFWEQMAISLHYGGHLLTKHSSYVVIASPSCKVILLCWIHMDEEKVACSQIFKSAAGQGGYTYNTVLALHLHRLCISQECHALCD